MFNLIAPAGRLAVRLYTADIRKERQALHYEVTMDAQPRLLPSRLGLWMGGAAALISDFELREVSRTEHDESWQPVCGERATVRDHYRELTLEAVETIAPHRTLRLIVRAYDQGIALRYELPEQAGLDSFTIVDDLTQWRFPEGCQGYDTKTAQGTYALRPIDEIGADCERPLTVVYPDGGAVAIGEAGNLDASRMKLRADSGRRATTTSLLTNFLLADTLEAQLAGPIHGCTPWQSPWRYILVGDSPGQLLEHNDLLLNLSPPCELADTSWIKPGKVIREITLSMEGARACVDFAATHNLQYIEFDAGWYGHEYLNHSDATSCNVDPERRGHHPDLTDVDIPAIVNYARERGIGVWCYVNRRALERQLEDVLRTLAEWGVVGIKFGFVEVGHQAWTTWLHRSVARAADYKLMVDIHDEYRVTGITRTYPNLLTVEGIRGNEEFPSATHNVTLPFTRFLCGPADYTICIASPRLKPRRCHQLAMAVVYFSPLQFVYWYDQPKHIPDDPDLGFLDAVPTTWDETRVLTGSIGHQVAIARRSRDTWFLGAMSGDLPVPLQLSCNFLMPGVIYQLTAWSDNPDTPRVEAHDRAVDSTQELTFSLPAAGGYAAIFRPA